MFECREACSARALQAVEARELSRNREDWLPSGSPEQLGAAQGLGERGDNSAFDHWMKDWTDRLNNTMDQLTQDDELNQDVLAEHWRARHAEPGQSSFFSRR